MSETANIAMALVRAAQAAPERIALRVPWGRSANGRIEYRELSYAELDRGSDEVAAGLAAIGAGRGERVALMVRPSEALFLIMFGAFKAGSVPVLIDPGIGPAVIKACLAEAKPSAFIGIPLAHVARIVLGWGRDSVRTLVTAGRRWFWRGGTLDELRAIGRARIAQGAWRMAETTPDELAAILFTSGSTGVPKGVEYRHRHFLAQVELIRSAFGIAPGEIDLPTFPPFALFDPGLGMTSVIPAMDPTRPARADPRVLIDTIARYRCTTMFGSPALLDNLSRYAVAHGVTLPALKRVLSAGAPVAPAVVERSQRMLPPDAEIWTPYGATECLPVAVIEGREILAAARGRTEAGAGICVGRPLPQNNVRIIRISDEPLSLWDDDMLAPTGEVGEITVAGPSVTESYFGREAATRLAKMREGDRTVHRMGDLGYFDAEGRLWYCGRKSHRVETRAGTLFSEMVEGVFNLHPDVKRSALVGVGPRTDLMPVICIELIDSSRSPRWPLIMDELRTLAERYPLTRGIREFMLHWGFPVDIRHNAKINRDALAGWAAFRCFYKPWTRSEPVPRGFIAPGTSEGGGTA
jgi:acyl-CoA synthetase (AMP-forming)/AMP-acid ligase II